MTQRSLSQQLDGRHLFVTGASGFLGKVWLAHLLEHAPNIGRITLLLRGRRNQTAEERLREMLLCSPSFRSLRAKLGTDFAKLMHAKLRVVAGDASEPHLGVNLKHVETVDAVVHIAGLTDFQPDPKLALHTNVLGTAHAAELAQATHGKRLLHVSTAFVAGLAPGVVPETVIPGQSLAGKTIDPMRALAELSQIAELEEKRERIDAATSLGESYGYPNIYTFTKALAEQLIACNPSGRHDDVRWTIARPAVVESSRAYPFAGWNEGVNTSGPLAWALMGWLRRFPSNPDLRFDVIPVDTVARAMTVQLGALLEDRAPEVFHLGSSSINPLPLGRCIDLTGFAGRRRRPKDALEWLMTQSDSIPRPAEHDPFPSMGWLASTAARVRKSIGAVDEQSPGARLLASALGKDAGALKKDWSQSLRNIERLGSRMDDVLAMYQPFIHDNAYQFVTDNIERLSAELSESDRNAFGFDLGSLDWRDYWLNVHIPGLEKWCFPILRGERPSEDAPPSDFDIDIQRLRVAASSVDTFPEPPSKGVST